MNQKIKIEGERGYYQVFVDGVEVALISGSRGEYWLTTNGSIMERKFIARFKYSKSVSHAKDFAKFVLKHVTAEEAAKRSADRSTSPMGWAEALGYVHPNLRKKRA